METNKWNNVFKIVKQKFPEYKRLNDFIIGIISVAYFTSWDYGMDK